VQDLREKLDELPVFVLKYEPRKAYSMALFMFLLMIAFIISTVQVTVEPNVDLPIPLSAVHMIMLAAAFFIIVLLDIVLTREIRFYKECVVKEWYLLGRKRIELEQASMSVFSVSSWRRRTIYPKNDGSLRIFRNLS